MDNPFQILDDRMQNIETMLQRVILFIEKQESNDNDKLISSTEARALFSPVISKSTLQRWCNNGLVIKRRTGGKVVFKKSEVELAAKKLRTYKTKSPMEMELMQ